MGLPGLNPSLLAPSLVEGTYRMMEQHDLLLKLEASGDPGCSVVEVPSGSKTVTVRCRKQLATKIAGIARLVVRTYAKDVRQVESPYLARAGPKLICAQNVDNGVTLLKGDVRGQYWLLTGVACTDEDTPSEGASSDEDDGSENYSLSPTARAVSLFEACLKEQMLYPDGPRSEDDSWCQGGAMRKIQGSMSRSGAAAKSFASHHTYSRLSMNEKLSFVYDLVAPQRPFDSLTFVLNAAQRPLRSHLDDADFLAAHGLQKTLRFHAASMSAAAEHDWWSAIYA